MNKNIVRLKEYVQILLIVFVLFLLAFIIIDGRTRLDRSATLLAQEQAVLAESEAERERVQDEKQYIHSDAFFERILRRNGMVRPEEIIYIIIYE